MMRWIAFGLAASMLLGFPAWASPSLEGQWQGVVHAQKDVRILLKVVKTGNGFKAAFYSIDESAKPSAEGPMVFDGKTIKFTSSWCNYNATLSGDVLKGTFCIGNRGGIPLQSELVRASAGNAWAIRKPVSDTSPHKTQMIAVEKTVRLEVLDWGGNGRPLVFLSGLGGNAHDFDKFAQRFNAQYHVYAITRRGNGKSDKPPAVIANYAADRLGDDVLAVMTALKLTKPVLAGFSIGGTELSSIGTRYPEKVSGLVYLDAAYAYAFYAPGNLDPVKANLNIDANDLRQRVSELTLNGSSTDAVKQIDAMLRALPKIETDLRAVRAYYAAKPPEPANTPHQTAVMMPTDAVFAGLGKYSTPKAPMLVIYALPERISPQAPEAVKAELRGVNKTALELAGRFAAGNPKAKVVYIAQSDHDVFNSNPDQVEREMKTFMANLH